MHIATLIVLNGTLQQTCEKEQSKLCPCSALREREKDARKPEHLLVRGSAVSKSVRT